MAAGLAQRTRNAARVPRRALNTVSASGESCAERQRGPDAGSLEELIIVCLEVLARLSEADGQWRRAAGLQDASAATRLESRRPGFDVHLTRREMEVARLITRGQSNRRIAAQMVVSTRTVDTHVSHILRKLGLASRAQIAAWIVEHERGTGLTLLA